MNKFAGFMIVLVMSAVAPLARADFEISVNGVDCAFLASLSPDGSLACATFSPVAGVTISGLSVTGAQVGSSFSEQLGTTLLINNTTGSSVTLTIDIADSNFSSPVTPPDIDDNSGATLNNATGKNTYTLKSCVDQANGLVPPGGVFCSSPAPGMAGTNPMLSQTGPGTVSNESTGLITLLSANFSLVQQLTIVSAPNPLRPLLDSDFNVTSSQILTSSPVPEPTSVLLLGSMLVGISSLLLKKAAKRS